MEPGKQVTEKRPYEKPKLRVIELVAEEVLGVGCKTPSGFGGPVKTSPCVACARPGS